MTQKSDFEGRRKPKWLVIPTSLLLLIGSNLTGYAAGSFTTQVLESRNYKIYVPSNYQAGTPVPLVVMLHGCKQNPDVFASGTEMNTIAEQQGFIAIYPEQPAFVLPMLSPPTPSSLPVLPGSPPPWPWPWPGAGLPTASVLPMQGNPSNCWNWFVPSHQARGTGGEPDIIKGMVDQVKAQFSIDEKAVYVAGLSAGGAMASILGAVYPDIFAAIGVGSGLEYKAATCALNLSCTLLLTTRCPDGGTEAWTAMCKEGGPDPEQQGNAVYAQMGSRKRVVPVVVVHGTGDMTVIPKNGDQVITQWAQINDLSSDNLDNDNIDDVADETSSGQVPSGRSFSREVYKDSSTAAIVMEKYIVNGMAHAWSGGSAADPYFDPQGPNASQIMWDFFKAHHKP
jgi:poly(hydroxyalkanoate) depolymerase family esterase